MVDLFQGPHLGLSPLGKVYGARWDGLVTATGLMIKILQGTDLCLSRGPKVQLLVDNLDTASLWSMRSIIQGTNL